MSADTSTQACGRPSARDRLPWRCRRLVPVSMGIVMFVLGLAVPLLIREPAKGRYTPGNKVRSHVVMRCVRE